MKTRIATVLALIAIFLSSTAMASELPAATKQARKEITKTIKKELKYPEFAVQEKFECSVVVSIDILEDGTMDVECANCVCPDVKEYVIKELENIESETLALYAGQNVKVKIVFDLLLI